MDKDTPKGLALARETLEKPLRAVEVSRQAQEINLHAAKALERAELNRAREALRAIEQARQVQETATATPTEGE
jgi:hypothetical protein